MCRKVILDVYVQQILDEYVVNLNVIKESHLLFISFSNRSEVYFFIVRLHAEEDGVGSETGEAAL